MPTQDSPLLSPRLPEVDHKSFESLFRAHYGLVRGFFRNRGVSDEDCSDLTQETFLGAYRGYAGFRGDANPKTWLLTIAKNLWRNFLRDRSAARRSGREVGLEGISESDVTGVSKSKLPSEDPFEVSLTAERRRLLRFAVAGLPTQMRRCFFLYYYQERKYREIAVILGVSIDTVKSQIHQAKVKLAHSLNDELAGVAATGRGEDP